MHTEPSPTDPSDTPPVAIRGGRLGTLLALLSWLGLLAWLGLVAAGRIDRAPGNALISLLFALPYLWLMHVVGVFCLWCGLPDRRSLPAVLGLSVVAGLWLWGPGLASWGRPAEADEITVLSWNVQRLWGDGEEASPGCVRAVLEREQPDIVAMMEISEENLRSLDGIGLQCVHTPYTAGGGERNGGLAVCGRGTWQARGTPRQFVAGQDWNYLAAEVERAGRVLNVLAVHLRPHHVGMPADRKEEVAALQADQSRALVERVARLRDPTIVAGDFNSTRDFWLHAALREHLSDLWEQGGIGFGATKHLWGWLPLRIDFVYVSREVAVHDARVLSDTCSDHLPVLGRLSVPAVGNPVRSFP